MEIKRYNEKNKRMNMISKKRFVSVKSRKDNYIWCESIFRLINIRLSKIRWLF